MPSFNQTQTVSEANTALKGEKQQHKSVSVTNSLWGKSKKNTSKRLRQDKINTSQRSALLRFAGKLGV